MSEHRIYDGDTGLPEHYKITRAGLSGARAKELIAVAQAMFSLDRVVIVRWSDDDKALVFSTHPEVIES